MSISVAVVVGAAAGAATSFSWSLLVTLAVLGTLYGIRWRVRRGQWRGLERKFHDAARIGTVTVLAPSPTAPTAAGMTDECPEPALTLPDDMRDPAWMQAIGRFQADLMDQVHRYAVLAVEWNQAREAIRRDDEERWARDHPTETERRLTLNHWPVEHQVLTDMERMALDVKACALDVELKRYPTATAELAKLTTTHGYIDRETGKILVSLETGLKAGLFDVDRGTVIPVDRQFRLLTDCRYGHAAEHLIVGRDGARVVRQCDVCEPPIRWTEDP